jgi:sulfite reductase (NADPH) flavoprotein alpha-component
MIGPGTGIAPFRAFVEEREALGATGKNWLFFGDQHFTTDFLYQTEWQRWLKSGTLTRMDVAFSRDQPQKIYVQHRLNEKSRDVYAWLEEGAAVYVCGDAQHMAADVHETLISIIAKEGGKARDAAMEYVQALHKTKRYQRDVY